jgi:hypothetical protein
MRRLSLRSNLRFLKAILDRGTNRNHLAGVDEKGRILEEIM